MNQNTNNKEDRALLQNIAEFAMADRGFYPEFSQEVFRELENIHGPAEATDPSIQDLRQLLWCSIDNDDSLDLDQLTVAIPIDASQTKILVAIADVDALVKKDSAIDQHAKHNTTSVYTDAEIFPMLPVKLSTNLTSLNLNEDRLAVVFEMTIAKDGTLVDSKIYRARVNNHAKLAYNSVAPWLDNEEPVPENIKDIPGLEENIRLQHKVADDLKALRQRNGSLNFNTIKTKAVFEGEKVKELSIEKSNSAKNLIEEFMVAANGVSARYLFAKNLPSVRRIVRVPKRWDRIMELAKEWGHTLPEVPDSEALDLFLRKAHNTDSLRFPDLSLSVIKLLGPGEYVIEFPNEKPIGHFGLAIKDYSHSTAPNRRYPDIITQRLLKAALVDAPMPYNKDELLELAAHCTVGEDEAKKVERQMTKSANAILMETKIGEKFNALVTGATERSMWVRLLYPPIEGKLMNPSKGLDVGDRLQVQLVHTDVERGFIDFKEIR
ncbi:MAG: RNB domain-containing ribonuclease [Candidatus Gracilibacteria bacterium]